jgi:hypothetical protein
MIKVDIQCSFDGDPNALADVIAQVIRTQTGQNVIVRVNRFDAPGTSTRVAAAVAQDYVTRRPNI